MASHQRLHEQFFFDMNAGWRFIIAVNHGRYAAFTTQKTGGSLANPFARFGRQCQLIAHMYLQ